MGQDVRDTGALTAGEESAERPRVVDEAHEVLTTYSWHLAGTGLFTVAAGFFGTLFSLEISPLWTLPVLGSLTLLYLAPLTREPRLAREVLRRWDRLRVDRALEASGISDDPRLEVAESMADRIVRHPAVDGRIRNATTALVTRLRRLVSDLGRVEYLAHAQITLGQKDMGRSISDLQDLLDGRAAEILGRIAQLHHTVVLRDTGAIAQVLDEAEDLIRELEAEREVERLLSKAERA